MEYELPPISDEQQIIIDAMNNNNCMVDAVAGSGKTTTSLHIATKYASKSILLLTYNKKLKIETREKIQILDIDNVEVHSYHSFCVKYYKYDCFTDYELIEIIKKQLPIKKSPSYDLIILDECQDMSATYFELVCKIVHDMNNTTPKMCILGDRYQSIFKFNKADERFIIYANRLFRFNELDWTEAHLSTSYRINNNMANFINRCVLGYNRLRAKKEGSKVRYIICDCFGNRFGRGKSNRPLQEVEYYLNKGYTYEDIFILAPSVKSHKSPVRLLANELSNNGIPIFVPNSDDERIDSDILDGKLVFSTFHQVKGLERKVVIVFNFDESYIKFYHKSDGKKCPNEIYVAITRAIDCMSLLHHSGNNFLPFVAKDKLKRYTDFDSNCKLEIEKNRSNKTHKIDVTSITRHLSADVLSKATEYYDTCVLQEEDEFIDIPIKTKQNDLMENVSDITGTAIPALFEYQNNGRMTIYNEIQKESNFEIDLETITIEELLKLANLYNSLKSNYNYKMNQIVDYDWLTDVNMKRCINRMDLSVPSVAAFEYYVEDGNNAILGKKLVGYIDCVDTDTVWEFKCTEKVEHEHFIQLAVYAYLWNKDLVKRNKKTAFRFKLLNILTNEIHELSSSKERLRRMIEFLIYSKYGDQYELPDDKFIERMIRIFKKYSGKKVGNYVTPEMKAIDCADTPTPVKPLKIKKRSKKITDFF